jgi:hypothetical protein
MVTAGRVRSRENITCTLPGSSQRQTQLLAGCDKTSSSSQQSTERASGVPTCHSSQGKTDRLDQSDASNKDVSFGQTALALSQGNHREVTFTLPATGCKATVVLALSAEIRLCAEMNNLVLKHSFVHAIASHQVQALSSSCVWPLAPSNYSLGLPVWTTSTGLDLHASSAAVH